MRCFVMLCVDNLLYNTKKYFTVLYIKRKNLLIYLVEIHPSFNFLRNIIKGYSALKFITETINPLHSINNETVSVAFGKARLEYLVDNRNGNIGRYC